MPAAFRRRYSSADLPLHTSARGESEALPHTKWWPPTGCQDLAGSPQRPRRQRPTSCDFVTWRSSHAGRRSAWMASSCQHPKTFTVGDLQAQSAIKGTANRRWPFTAENYCFAADIRSIAVCNEFTLACISLVSFTLAGTSWTAISSLLPRVLMASNCL